VSILPWLDDYDPGSARTMQGGG